MTTLPRSTKYPSASSVIFQRPQSEFDAGINTSAAWTEHLETGSAATDPSSLSDEEPENDTGENRPARALYEFEGKAEFRELSVTAGDDLDVIKEDLADGWSLVRNRAGEVGLLPQTYYTFTLKFTLAPDLEVTGSDAPFTRTKEASAGAESITPRASPKLSTPQIAPIVPQNTGEWRGAFPNFRQSLLGGKSLNRFSSFVTSGAEEFVLKGTPADVVISTEPFPYHERDASDATIDEEEINRLSQLGMGEADRHFVDVGPAWKEKLPPFRVIVHSPSKRSSVLSGAFTMYSVTSLFHPNENADEGCGGGEDFDYSDTPVSPTRITVHRRFSHFVILHTALTRRLPGIALPPLPEKQYAGRFSEDFVEARRGDLERYIGRVVRHPVARYAEVMTFFLGCESDAEWKRLVPQHLAMPAAGPAFYARVFHPAYNIDVEDAEDALDRFDTHTKAVGRGVQDLRNIFGRVREARVEMSKAERLLAYSLLSLITSKPLASVPRTEAEGETEGHDVKSKGLVNENGAWCWREDCRDCLNLTKAMQKTSETLQSVADIYDDHARRTQLATHESLKGMAHPSLLYEGVVTTHKSTLSRYREALQEGRTDEDMAARCETVLNTTMAEMETYHTQKGEDFHTLMKEHLDDEIAVYEQVLSRIKSARQAFEPPLSAQLAESPRQPSIYERELENPRLSTKPLMQPCPHVFDSAPMRPVSVAIQEGVGLFLGPAARGSVFGKFW
ncbi:hypothetical protein L208DRAFT_1447540 [Tricholoma matsutake]|nr:hypothetical protein L208DRAFT_1447540 [Tricholoma matsutake 945]